MPTLIIVVCLLTGGAMLLPWVRGHGTWRAMVTPLASIIGSGFLILGPVLAHDYGSLAPVAMAALCLVAWGFGSSIRANIARIGDSPAPETAPERAGNALLAVAYVVSVAYYLNLFGAFAVNLTPFDSDVAGRVVTTVAYGVILTLGWTSGFGALEKAEYSSVSLKLAIIAGLLAALALYFFQSIGDGTLITPAPQTAGWQSIAVGFGLLVTVQGFETSRYLGEEYSARVRIDSMRLAQALATGIYLIYVALLVYTVPVPEHTITETEIINMMAVVAPILPPLLVAAALAAQFSAAVADTSGSGGLMSELTNGKLTTRHGYLLLVLIGVGLTWVADVFEIVSYASRAFAAYYAVQCFIAARHASGGPRVLHASLAVLAVAIAILGTPVEG